MYRWKIQFAQPVIGIGSIGTVDNVERGFLPNTVAFSYKERSYQIPTSNIVGIWREKVDVGQHISNNVTV